MGTDSKRGSSADWSRVGQATTEYILMLFLAVSSFLVLKNTLFKGAYQSLQDGLSTQIQNLLFPAGEGSMHRLRIR
jgi:hypothetical protein